MPFEPQSYLDAGVRAPGLIQPPEPVEVPPYTLGPAAARQSNWMFSAYNYMQERSGFTYDPDHNPIDLIKDTHYEANYLHRFVDSRSSGDTMARMRRIDQEEADRKLLDAGGFEGFVAQFAAGLLDPTLLIPGTLIFRGAAAGRATLQSAGAGAGLVGGTSAIQAGMLHATQETRTGVETTMHVATGVIVGSLLGGAIGYLTAKQLAELTDTIDGLRRAVNTPDERITPLEAFAKQFGVRTSADKSAGGADVQRYGLTLQGALGVEKALAFGSPVTRLQTSPFDSVRASIRDLADAGLSYRDNALGVPTSGIDTGGVGTVETRVKLWRGAEFQFYEALDNAYAKYAFDKTDPGLIDQLKVRTGLATLASRRGGKLSKDEFNTEVTRVARNPHLEHPSPHVMEAAQAFRALDEQLKKAAIDAEIPGFSDEMKVLGARAHVFRMYNREKIIAQRHGKDPETGADSWTDTLLRPFKAKHAESVAAFEAGKARRVARLEEAAADLELPHVIAYSNRVAELQAARKAHREANAGFQATDQELRVLRSRLIKERTAKDTDAVTATQEEIAAVQAMAGAEYTAYRTALNALDTRLRRVRTNARMTPERRADSADIMRGQIANVRTEPAKGLAAVPEDQLLELVNETTHKILGESTRRIPGLSIVRGPQGALKERILDIPDHVLAPFLENDIEKIARATVRTMAGDIEVAAKFGDVNMTEQFARTVDEHAAKQLAAASPKERIRLKKRFDQDMKDLELLRDRARGFDMMPDNPDGWLYRSARVALNLSVMSKLGMQTWSSIADLSRPIMRYGLDAFRDGWVPLVSNFSSVRLAAQEVRLAGTGIDLIRDQRALALADVMEDFGRNTKFERGVQWGADRFSLLTAMAPWNGALRSLTGVISMAGVLKATKAVATGKATQKQITRLAEDGIDDAMARRIWAHAEQHGDNIKGVFLPNTKDWKLSTGASDNQAIEAFRAVINREAETLIVQPGLERPRWMSTTMGKVLGQFKSFALVSTQRTLIAGLQQRDAAVLQGVLISLALGALSAKMKNDFRGERGENTSTWTQGKWAVEALDNSGLLGVLMEANNISEKVTGGGIGLSRFSGKEVSRYASRNLAGALGGPTLDAITDVATLGRLISKKSADKWSGADTHAVRKVIPLQNLFWLRSIFDKAEKGINNSLNIPQQRPRH